MNSEHYWMAIQQVELKNYEYISNIYKCVEVTHAAAAA